MTADTACVTGNVPNAVLAISLRDSPAGDAVSISRCISLAFAS